MPSEKRARAPHYFFCGQQSTGICLQDPFLDFTLPPGKRIKLPLECFLDDVCSITTVGRCVRIQLSGKLVGDLNVCHGQRVN